ncbi:MAG: hypothetical protein BGN87_23190 [Rhizobiales bacterium 65-79]|nr:MAG: hypothetical protein BGN87_23190 [Rhizobiales bacterium 65-79]
MSTHTDTTDVAGPKRRFGLRIPTTLLLLLPGLAVFSLFFVLPLAILAVNSFHGYSRLSGISPDFTIENYVLALSDRYYIIILTKTFSLALSSAFFTFLVGYPVALYFYSASERQQGWIILLILSPLLVSVIVRTFGWLVILGPNGLVDVVFKAFGLEGGSILYSQTAVVIGLVNVFLPFFVLSVATSLNAIDPAVPLAASSLGASPLRVFASVVFPLSMPGIASGLLIIFSLSSSSFVTPALLGGSKFRVLSTEIYQDALVLQNWPFAASLAIILIFIVLAVLVAQNTFVQHSRYRVVFH